MSSLQKCLIWKEPSGKLRFTSFFAEGMKKNETEDEFITRSIAKMEEDRPVYKTYQRFFSTKSEIKSFLNLSPIKDMGKLRIHPNGELYFDESIISDKDKREALRTSIRSKLLTLG